MNKATRELLEAHFDTAFAAPDGIKKLRELILTLAMQGKLVAQDPNDPPASQLLKNIEAEKKRLVKEGKIKAPKPLPEITPEEVPYALPQGWQWVRLGEIGVWKSGSTPSRTNSKYYGGEIPWVKSGEVKQGRIAQTEESITELALKECSLSLNPKGSVLVAMYGANIGEVGILDIEATTNQAVCACNTFTAFDEKYLLNLIASLKQYFISQGAGAAQPNISREKIVTTLSPLPPLPEQHRIVAKIDELMARCDELEKLRDEREQKRRSVHSAALKQLLDAQAGGNFTDAWQFLTLHFGELYAVRENVTELRKAILQLAVMGKLVPQNPNDPPASQLLKEIEAEKKRLAKEGKIKAPKPLPEIKPEDVPYALPQGWEWVRLGEIGVWKSGSTPSRTNSKYYGGSIPWVKSGEVKQGRISQTEESITELALAECSLSLNPKGSVLVAMYGANIGEVGILDIEATTNQAVCACNTFTAFDEKYLLNLIASLKQYFISQGAGAAQPNISREKIVATLFPLPPLPEQHRIVAKIDQLMALCDTLEQQIDASTRKQTSLLDVVMAQV